MINTAPPASNCVYGSENWFFNSYNKFTQICGTVTVVKELLACADELASTPGVTVFCFSLDNLFFFLFYFSPSLASRFPLVSRSLREMPRLPRLQAHKAQDEFIHHHLLASSYVKD